MVIVVVVVSSSGSSSCCSGGSSSGSSSCNGGSSSSSGGGIASTSHSKLTWMYCQPWSTYVTMPYPRIAAKNIEKVNMTCYDDGWEMMNER